MNEQLSVNTFIPWLVREAHRVAQEISDRNNASAYLWSAAVEALDWLRHASVEEREQTLQTLKQCIDTRGASAGITIPSDPHEAKCLITLLLFVHNPPSWL